MEPTALLLAIPRLGALAWSQTHGTLRWVRLWSHLDARLHKHPHPHNKFNYSPWNWKPFLPFPSTNVLNPVPPWFIFLLAVYPQGQWKTSQHNKAVWLPTLPLPSQHVYTEHTGNLNGTWYVISWKHSSVVSLLTLQVSDSISGHQSGLVSSGFTL